MESTAASLILNRILIPIPIRIWIQIQILIPFAMRITHVTP